MTPSTPPEDTLKGHLHNMAQPDPPLLKNNNQKIPLPPSTTPMRPRRLDAPGVGNLILEPHDATITTTTLVLGNEIPILRNPTIVPQRKSEAPLSPVDIAKCGGGGDP